MSTLNTGATTRADEEHKEGGEILIGAICTKKEIICLQPERDCGEAGERADAIMRHARETLYSKVETGKLGGVLWDKSRDHRLSFRGGQEGLAFFVLSKGENMIKPATCLELIEEAFMKELKNSGTSVGSLSYQAGFEDQLKAIMHKPVSAKDEAYNTRVQQVIALGLEAIELQLERQQKLEYTEELSKTLVESSDRMRKTSSAVRKKYCWENAKCWIGIAVIVVIIVIILVIAICVSTQKCK